MWRHGLPLWGGALAEQIGQGAGNSSEGIFELARGEAMALEGGASAEFSSRPRGVARRSEGRG